MSAPSFPRQKPQAEMARPVAEGARNLADVKRAAEGLQALQKAIAESGKGKKPVSWSDFKSAVEEGHSGSIVKNAGQR